MMVLGVLLLAVTEATPVEVVLPPDGGRIRVECGLTEATRVVAPVRVESVDASTSAQRLFSIEVEGWNPGVLRVRARRAPGRGTVDLLGADRTIRLELVAAPGAGGGDVRLLLRPQAPLTVSPEAEPAVVETRSSVPARPELPAVGGAEPSAPTVVALPRLEAAWHADTSILYLTNHGPGTVAEMDLQLADHHAKVEELRADWTELVMEWEPPPAKGWEATELEVTAHVGATAVQTRLAVSPYGIGRPTPAPAAPAGSSLVPPTEVRGLEIARIDRTEGLPGQRRLILEDVVRDSAMAWFRLTLKGGAEDKLTSVTWEHGGVSTFSGTATGKDLEVVVQVPRELVGKKSKLQLVFEREGKYTVPLKASTFSRFLRDLF